MPDSTRVLVCGASGQDGTLLSRLLLAKGCTVVGTARHVAAGKSLPAPDTPHGQFTWAALEMTDRVAMQSLLAAARPGLVFNLAGQSSVGKSFQQPAETIEGIATGTLNLLEAILQVDPGIRLFNAGSGEMFGDLGGVPANESSPISPCSPYASAKAAAYASVAAFRRDHGLFACTGILFNHESPLRSNVFVTRKVVAAAVRISRGSTERLQLGNFNVQRDWGWASEYVDAMHRMLLQDQPRDLVIATGTTIGLEEFTDAAFSAVGLRWRDHVEFDRALARPTDIAVVRADPSLAAEYLGWRAETRGPDVARRMVEAELSSDPR